jgi:hypothetical protein
MSVWDDLVESCKDAVGIDVNNLNDVADVVDELNREVCRLKREKMYSEEEVEKTYIDAYHKGYNVGQKDAELHPLALTIADNIHKDKEEWFEQFKKK